jgi:hypothetical protein
MYIHTYHILFSHLSVDGHWDCFHVLAILNNAAMNVDIQKPIQVCFNCFRYVSRSGLARSYGDSMFMYPL